MRKTHPAAAMFPLLEGSEYRALVESIRADGLQSPIVVTADGQILDGRNRLRACVEAGVRTRLTTYKGADPWGFVVAANIHRRHLTTDQRASLALRLLPRLKRDHPKGMASKEAIRKTATAAARLAGVSTSTVERAIRVEQHADLALEVRSGRMTYSRADHILRAREHEKSLPRKPVTCEVRHGDFRKVLTDLENVDAIITDPPYARASLKLFGDLAIFADKVLAPTGVLAVMTGLMYLPDVMRELDGRRPYRWTLAVVHHQMMAVYARKVAQLWKPVLVYGNGERINGDVIDATSGSTRHHVWAITDSRVSRSAKVAVK